MTTVQSAGDKAIDAAARRNSGIFVAYIVILLVTTIVIAVFTWLAWDSGNKLQDAIRQDANARIQEASHGVAQLQQDNLTLSSTLEEEKGKVAGLQKDASDAKAAQQRVEIELEKQREKAAVAERALLALKESLKDRIISDEQQEGLIKALTGEPTGTVEIWWVASDSDAYQLALRIKDILNAAGWTKVTERLAIRGTGNGLFIGVHNINAAPAYAGRLQHAFDSVGIPIEGFSRADITEGTVLIYIGHKVQPN